MMKWLVAGAMQKRAIIRIGMDGVLQLGGTLIPALLLIAALPILKTMLGEAEFATVAVLLTAISLLGVADAGLGRAVTFASSRQLANGDRAAAFAGLLAGCVLGAIVSTVTAGAAWLAIDDHNFANGVDAHALQVLIVFLPVFVLGGMARGFLEAEQRFLAGNVLQMLIGATSAVSPILVLSLSREMWVVALAFGLLRSVQTWGYFRLIARGGVPESPMGAVKTSAHEIVRYARWLLLSNLTGVAIVFADRILVAARFPAAEVAAYLVPMELVLRGQVIFVAISSVVFPRLVRLARQRFGAVAEVTIGLQLALAGTMMLGAYSVLPALPALLALWMGPEFSEHATQVVELALLGLGMIAVANFAMTALNADGETALPAVVHAIELPLYAAGLWLASSGQILQAVIYVWLTRLAIDMIAMQALLMQRARLPSRTWLGFMATSLASTSYYLFVALMPSADFRRAWFVIGGALLGAGLVGWAWRLTAPLRIQPESINA
jgi:O-antigen/teichoic acid export membrane protein